MENKKNTKAKKNIQEINGVKIADKIFCALRKLPRPKKFLAIFIVDENPAIASFVEQKRKFAEKLKVDFRVYKFPKLIKNDELRKNILKTATHKTCGGMIVQLPLPKHLNKHYVINVIPREKDVDVLGERALGAFYTNRNQILPPAVATVSEVIENCKLKIENYRVAVVGLGFLVGKPTSLWLMGKCREIYLLDKGGNFDVLKKADLVISGAGKANLIKPSMLKERSTIIDFGFSFNDEKKIRGDFDTDEIKIGKTDKFIAYTPNPGGTGPIVVAKLFENFYELNKEVEKNKN